MTGPNDDKHDKAFPLAGAIAIYTIAFITLAWPWLVGNVTIPWDAKSQFFPQLSFMARSFAEGQSPFWTPNIYAGWPQIADPQSLIFSPLHVALALFDPNPSFRASDAIVFAHIFLGGVGIILIFRERGWHVGGALVAALAFSFGGANASRIQHVGQVESLCWLPLALFFLMRALERRSWSAGAASGLFAGLIMIGRDQVSLIALYVLLGFLVWHWCAGEGRVARLRASLVPLLAGAVVGALIVSLPVLLTQWLADNSNRPEIGYEFAGRGSLHPVHLLTLFFGDLFGANAPSVPYWGPPSFEWRDAWGTDNLYLAQNMGQMYAGALVTVSLIVFGLLRGVIWAKEIRFFTIAAAVVLLYALGRYSGAFYFMYEFMPGVSLFRRPADATFVFCALLAIIAGYVVHAWLSEAVEPLNHRERRIALMIALGLVAIAVVLAIPAKASVVVIVPVVMGLLFAGGAMAALDVARKMVSPLTAAMVLAVFSVADLGWNNGPNESTGLPPATYDEMRRDTANETIKLIKERLANASPDRRDRVELLGIAYHWPNLGLIHNFDHLFAQNPIRLSDFEAATEAADTVAVSEQRKFSAALPSFRSTLEDLFGVRYIAIGVPIEKVDPKAKPEDFPLIARTKDAYVYENPRALPRVMLLGDWRHANFSTILKSGWPDVDPKRTVLLEKPPRAAGSGGGTAKIASYKNTEIVVETDASAPSLLVLNDVWHPWWSACVDSADADILKANVLFRAVEVPAGKHTVRFSFHPLSGLLNWLGLSSSAPRC